MKELQNSNVKDTLVNKLKKLGKNTLDTFLSGADSALYRIPSDKSPALRQRLEEFYKAHPGASTTADVIGDALTYYLPGKMVKYGLKGTKIGKPLTKALNAKGVKGAVSRSTLYGGAHGVTESLTSDRSMGREATRDILGSLFGEAVMGANAKLLKVALPLFKKGGKFAAGREKVKEMASNLYNKLDKTTKSKLNNGESLIHNATEQTKAIADKAYKESPKARKIINKQAEEFQNSQAAKIEDALIEANKGKSPDAEKLYESMKQKYKGREEKLYNKAFNEDKKITLDDRAKGNAKFKQEHKTTMKNVNEVDANNPLFKEDSIRQIHNTKRSLRDKQKVAKSRGKDYEYAQYQEAIDPLKKALDSTSENYAKGSKIAQRRFQVKEAMKLGKKFHSLNNQEIQDALKNMSPMEKMMFKESALTALAGRSEDKATKSITADLSKDFVNPNVKKKLGSTIGEKEAQELADKAEKLNRTKKNFDYITKSGKAVEHEQNINARDALNAFKALKLNPRGVINTANKAKQLYKGVNANREGGTTAKLLLNPHLLEKFGKNVPKEDADKYMKHLLSGFTSVYRRRKEAGY